MGKITQIKHLIARVWNENLPKPSTMHSKIRCGFSFWSVSMLLLEFKVPNRVLEGFSFWFTWGSLWSTRFSLWSTLSQRTIYIFLRSCRNRCLGEIEATLKLEPCKSTRIRFKSLFLSLGGFQVVIFIPLFLQLPVFRVAAYDPPKFL